MFDSLIAITATVLFSGVFIWYCYLLKKAHPKEDLGAVLTSRIILNNETIMMFLLICAAVAEGLSAATVFALDATVVHTNPLAKIISHTFITATGIVCTITFFRDLASVVEKDIDNVARFARVLSTMIVVLLALGSPIANVMLLAGNLKQEDILTLYFYGMFADNETWLAILKNWGYPHNWSAWAAMQPALKTGVFIGLFHLAVGLLEGFRSLAAKNRRERVKFVDAPKAESETKEKDKEKPAPKEGDRHDEMEAEKRQYDKIDDTLRYLFLRIGYEGTKLKTMVESAKKIIDSTHNTDKKKATNMVAIASKLKIDGETIKNTTDADEKKKKNKDLDERIHKFFTASKNNTGDAVGLSMTLKKN